MAVDAYATPTIKEIVQVEMTKQILLIVERAADCPRVAKLLRMLHSDKEIRGYALHGRECHVTFNAGGRIHIKSQQDWNDCTIRGAAFDHVVFLCEPSDYIIDQVGPCLVFSLENEKERIIS